MANFIKKGDIVKILSGKDRAKTGKVAHVSTKRPVVTVEGRNLYFRHERPKKQGEKGQRIQFPRPIQISNVMLVCPHCGKTTRTAYLIDDKGVKTRSCKNCHKRIA